MKEGTLHEKHIRREDGARSVWAPLRCIFVATLAAGGRSPGPSLAAPGPEVYHIYDGREGIQTQAEVINASRAVAIVEDPAYSDPVTMIVFGMSPTSRYMETYNHNGYVLSNAHYDDESDGE